MRMKRNNQLEFDFQPSGLKITREHFARYERISRILDSQPGLIDLVHKDLRKILKSTKRNGPGRSCAFSSETVLRMIICQIIEDESLRNIVIQIDDSNYLRRFVGIYGGRMIDYTTFCTLKNAIRPETWKRVNDLLLDAAIEQELISGDRLRIDTTCVETNIHWPTDSSLLWDTYRVLSRLVATARKIDAEVASDKRLQPRRVKKLHTAIARKSGKKGIVSHAAKSLYEPLIGHVERILEWVPTLCARLQAGLEAGRYGLTDAMIIEGVIYQLEHFRELGIKVVDQAHRRVIGGEKVPNEEKIFSIFEPHTELLKRGKAGKPIEFGHMVLLQQLESKFISDYEVFERKPLDQELVRPALESHRKRFGENPSELSADKGFYESMEEIDALETEIDVVSICKKGSRTSEEAEREATAPFRFAQRFRAGVEGTISYLKRCLGLWRCRNKGWEHYAATVGATVFAHNLLILARGYG